MIRPYKPSDKTSLIKLIRLNTPKYFAPSEEDWFSDFLDKEVEDYFVIENNNNIVGCGGVNYEKGENIAVLSWGMIHPNHHKQGLGSFLTKHRINHVKTVCSAKRIIVRTSQHTYGFYLKMGFTLTKTKENHWGPGLDLYYMEMSLE